MITGHYATALIPYAQNRKFPLFLLLIVSQFPDFFIPLDIAITGESNFRELEMKYSHDILPVFVFTAVVAIIVQLVYKNKKLTLWCIGLMLFHEVCDLLAGFAHNVYGQETPRLGFDLYRENQLLAYSIELILSIACIAYFMTQRKKQGLPLSTGKGIVLIGTIIIPIVAMMVATATGNPLF